MKCYSTSFPPLMSSIQLDREWNTLILEGRGRPVITIIIINWSIHQLPFDVLRSSKMGWCMCIYTGGQGDGDQTTASLHHPCEYKSLLSHPIKCFSEEAAICNLNIYLILICKMCSVFSVGDKMLFSSSFVN